VTFRPNTPSKGQEELKVQVISPRVVICRAVVEERNGNEELPAFRMFHPTIGSHGGLSSPLPEIGEGVNRAYFAKVYARLEPSKQPPPPPGSCPLKTQSLGVDQGDEGDRKEFTVSLKSSSNGDGEYSLWVEVAILNPKVEICSDTILWYEGNNLAAPHTSTVSIGVHGGRSSTVLLPADADGLLATVTARWKR
jgi:hypothetical protein